MASMSYTSLYGLILEKFAILKFPQWNRWQVLKSTERKTEIQKSSAMTA
jgi:hypothetical protein